MYHNTKVATCCYCGTRATLTLSGKVRHELACSNCGAPLHDMKMLKAEAPRRPEPKRQLYSEPKRQAYAEPKSYKKSKKKKKRGKSLGQRFLGEVWDVAEDIFDVFD